MNSSDSKPKSGNLSEILEGLIKADVKFILVGGLAAVIQGAPVTTLDVDILHDRSKENTARLYRFLKSIDAIFRRPDDKIIKPTEKEFSGLTHGLFTTLLGPLDVLAVVEEGKTYTDLIEHAIEIQFRGHALHVLDLKTLIALKKASSNPKHQQQLPVLEETLRQLENIGKSKK